MPVLPQDLQAGELTSVPESGFYGEDEDDEPKAEEKSEDVLNLDESTEGETVVSDRNRGIIRLNREGFYEDKEKCRCVNVRVAEI